MTERLDGTVALVTGASSGIGEATARALASHGAAVSLVARRKDRLETLAKQISESGGKALVIEADITQQDQAIAAVEQTVKQLGRLDTVVNNAGVMLLGPIEGAPVEEWDRMVSTNVLGLLYITHAALPHLLQAADSDPRKVADVVNISSTGGRIASQGVGVYNFTKFGVVGFTESLRQEVAARHVRVSVVEPGATVSELATHIRPEVMPWLAERFKGMPSERLQSADIADAIAYIVTRPRRMAVNEMLVRPTDQER